MIEENKYVIKGEAPESDDEEIASATHPKLTYGLAVDGEAPESDEEIVSFCKDAVGQLDDLEPIRRRFDSLQHPNMESILQRKLMESNVNLWRNLTNFIQSTVLAASKKLLGVDQQLIKSQVQVQGAASSLKIASNNAKQVLDKTRDVVTANFIPDIKI